MTKDKVFNLIHKEERRQKAKIGLIPSENNISPDVAKALGSDLTNKYAEGYPGARYYEGNQVIDEIELLAQERLKKLPVWIYVVAVISLVFALTSIGLVIAGGLTM